MEIKYDPNYLRQFYDQYGEREWTRFEQSPAKRVNYHIHQWYLQQYIKRDDVVLDVGAGPGRFTIEIAKLGAKIVVGDISSKQLELNQEKVQEAGYEDAVVVRKIMDIVDLSLLPSGSFDNVVCYGGPLSYVFDRVDDALYELLRVTKVGGHVLLSVISLLGSTHAFLPVIFEPDSHIGLEAIQQVNTTGNLYGDTSFDGHYCHMFRWAELQSLLARYKCTVTAASASNFLSMRSKQALERITHDAVHWKTFLSWEVDFCKEPGAIDSGTHMIVVIQKQEDTILS